MTNQTLTEYLKNLEKRQTTPFVINNNGGFYICKGEYIPEKEFLDLFPLGDKIRTLHSGQFKGDNIGSI